MISKQQEVEYNCLCAFNEKKSKANGKKVLDILLCSKDNGLTNIGQVFIDSMTKTVIVDTCGVYPIIATQYRSQINEELFAAIVGLGYDFTEFNFKFK